MFASVYLPEPPADPGELLRIGDTFSPKVQTVSAQTVAFAVSGLQRRYPTLPELGQAILARARVVHADAHTALAYTVSVAIQAAMAFSGLTIVPKGQETSYLAPLSPDALSLPPQVAEVLQQWGITTLGQLAALPEAGLVARFGPLGQQMRQAAQGSLRRLFIPDKPPLLFSESTVLEHPLSLLEPLMFVVANLLDQICGQLEQQSLATAELQVELRMENQAEYRRTHHLPVPTRHRKTLLQLIHLDLEAHRPESPVTAISLLAQPAAPRTWQQEFFAVAQPEPEKLEITLARLHKLLGAGRLGRPVLLDTHQPDAVVLERFLVPTGKAIPPNAAEIFPAPALSLRYYRPARPAHVRLLEDRPAQVEAQEIRGRVLHAAGPWPNSGHWWTPAPWARDDWDVSLETGVLYRLFRDHVRSHWFVEGYYD